MIENLKPIHSSITCQGMAAHGLEAITRLRKGMQKHLLEVPLLVHHHCCCKQLDFDFFLKLFNELTMFCLMVENK
jgi:hypothetical protein